MGRREDGHEPRPERRRRPRMALTLPVKIQGYETNGDSWDEMGSVRDVSPGGVGFLVKHPLSRGHVLFLSLPLPKRFRSYDLFEPSYRVYALVRSVVAEGSSYRVGVMLLGRNPPRDHEKDPGGLFLLPSDQEPSRARRRFPRLDIHVNVRLRGAAGSALEGHVERTIAENIGRGGARVMSALPVDKGDVVRFEEVDGNFKTRAEVCNRYIGEDNIPRLNLAFLDKEAPEHLVGTG
jgi:hypothetical protein